MEYKRCSLCISSCESNNFQSNNFTWRLADFNFHTQCFENVQYLSPDWPDMDTYSPKRIYAPPHTIKQMKADVRYWDAFESDRLPLIRSDLATDIIPFELIFAPELKTISEISVEEVQGILFLGITLPEYVGEQFCLVLQNKSDLFEVLVCDINDFSLVDGKYRIKKLIHDLITTKTHLPLEQINKFDVFYSSASEISTREDESISGRLFYRRLDFEFSGKRFPMRKPEHYAPAYINKYLATKKDVLDLTKRETQKLSDSILVALKSQEEIQGFYDGLDLDQDEMLFSFEQLADEIRNLYLEQDMLSRIVERCLLADPKVYEKCVEVAESQWLLNNKEMKTQAMEELELIKKEQKQVTHELHLLKDDVQKTKKYHESLLQKKEQLHLEAKILEGKNDDIRTNIVAELKDFQDDIVHLAAMTAFSSPSVKNTGRDFLWIEGARRGNSPEEISSISDFSEELDENLRTLGMKPDISFDYSEFITSAILTENHFIVCGGCGENIANSLSYLLDSQSAGRIFLDNTSISSFHSQIQSVKNHVIIIYNALNTFNEGLFLSAVKLCLNKVLFFVCEDRQTYEQFPVHWGNYAIFLFPEEFCFAENDNEVSSSEFDLNNATYEKEKEEVAKNKDLRKMKRLLSTRPYLRIESLCNMSKDLFTSAPLSIPFLQHLRFICKEQEADFNLFLSESSADTSIKEKFLPKSTE